MLVELRRRGEAAKRHLRGVLPGVDLDSLLDEMRLGGLVKRVGRAGGTQYQLSDGVIRRAGMPAGAEPHERSSRLLQQMRRAGSLSAAEAAKLLDIEPAAARRVLSELAAAGEVRRSASRRHVAACRGNRELI